MKIFACIFVFFFSLQISAKEFSFEINIKNQPETDIIFGAVKGDKFIPIDTFRVIAANSEKIKLEFPISSNQQPGIYGLVLGQTTFAKVMNEPPQMLNFIFNNENIAFETDFNSPADSLTVLLSEENRIWFDFQKNHKKLIEEISWAEKEIDYYRLNDNQIGLQSSIKKFNQLQTDLNNFIHSVALIHQGLFVSELVVMYRRPFVDGKLTPNERKISRQNNFFSVVHLSNKNLINSSLLNSTAFEYLMSFADPGLERDKQIQQFIKACENILTAVPKGNNTLQKNEVYEFLLDYLVRGFEKLNQPEAIEFLATKYSGTTCQTDEKTTLERKLEAVKMKKGTKIANFEMYDINGDLLRFSEITKDTTILIFWASWCTHCVELLPALKSADINSNTEIILVSLDTSRNKWQNFIYENNLDKFYNLCDFQNWDGKTAQDLNVFATPTFFIINQQLEIVEIPNNFQQLKEWL